MLKEFKLIIDMTSVFFLSILRPLPACDSHSQKYVHLFVMGLWQQKVMNTSKICLLVRNQQ